MNAARSSGRRRCASAGSGGSSALEQAMVASACRTAGRRVGPGRGSVPVGEVLPHGVGPVTHRLDRLLDLVGRHPEGLGPVADLVFLLHVDSLAILAAGLALV